MKVLVQGSGIAARCCEHLLIRANGFQVLARPDTRVPVPVLMLGEPALALMRDVFANQDLWRNASKIRNRVVAWQPDAPPQTVPHSAVVVSERSLLEAVALSPENPGNDNADFSIHSTSYLPVGVADHSFGTRKAYSRLVALRPGTAPETCWIESVARGWLFLIPANRETTWLLSVGDAPDMLLAQSRLIVKHIQRIGQASRAFTAYPRVTSPLCGPGWIACGAAAMGFDPICGDGTAHAVREGILASAVVRAISRNGNAEALCRHYEARLLAGLARHLQLCCDFYQSGYGGPWWDQELELARQGLAWCRAKLAAHGPFRYKLNGFELEPLVP